MRRAIKRGFDVIATVVGLVLLSPILLLFAILVKLDSRGPVIYKQLRIGENCHPFMMYKFRSMRWTRTRPFTRRTSPG